MTTVLEEVMRVEGNDSSLIRLGNIGKDDVDHGKEHTVLVGVSGVLNDGNDVGSLLGHVDEVSTGSVRELNGVDGSLGSNDIGDVRNGGSGSGSKVENLM